MIDLDEIEVFAKKATKGPWRVEWESCDCEYPCSHTPYAIGLSHCCYDDMPDDDFIFIAALNPSAALELIARLRQAEKDAARYRWLRDRAFKNDILSLLASHPSEWDEMVDEATQGEQRQ